MQALRERALVPAPSAHPLGELRHQVALGAAPAAQPLHVLLHQQQLLGAEAQLEGGGAVVLGAELHLQPQLAPLLLQVRHLAPAG